MAELRADMVCAESDYGGDKINSGESRAGAKIAAAETARVRLHGQGKVDAVLKVKVFFKGLFAGRYGSV